MRELFVLNLDVFGEREQLQEDFCASLNVVNVLNLAQEI